MLKLIGFINELKPVDIVFFIICVAIVAIGIGVYFLIPVFNKKQYQEQRDNLRKREEAFKSNYTANSVSSKETEEEPAQLTSDDKGNSK